MSTTPASGCPSLEDLDRMAQGEPVDDSLVGHVDWCSECAQRLVEFRANNDLVSELSDVGDRAASASPAVPPRLTEKGYRVLSEIHRGGQGVVYLCEHEPTSRRVAVKVLLRGVLATERQRSRFEREVELLAGLRHPGIVTVYDSGTSEDGQAYLAMEYLEGQTLADWIAEDRALIHRGPCDRLRLFGLLCDAVTAAHQRGVIHRDLKPDNVLVGENNKPHVLDFGVAKATESSQPGIATHEGEFVGTFAYAAPEQLESTPDCVDVRTDVYGLGLILYEVLTGERARPSGAAIGELLALARVTPPRPSSSAPDINGELDAITCKALDPDPVRRYQSAEALRDDITRYLSGLPIEAKRGRRWYSTQKFITRHRIPIASAAALVLLLIGATAVSLSLLRGARIEAAKTNSIRIFLEDTLGSVTPDPTGDSPDVPALLDEAVHWIEIALADQPEVAASLRGTIGNSYRVLGRLDEAEVQISTALETRRRLHGERHPDFAQSLNRLALLRRDQGRLDDAEELARRALGIRESRLGVTNEPVVISRMNLGSILRAKGDYSGAAEQLRVALDTRRRLHADPSPDIAMCYFRLAELSTDAGGPAEALRQHELALEMRRATVHPEHPDLARSLAATAGARLEIGRDDATGLAIELVGLRRVVFGVGHWRTAEAELLHARCLAVGGGVEEARRVAGGALEVLETDLGHEHPLTRGAREFVAGLRGEP